MTPAEFEALPYRPCVGVMLINRDGLVWVGSRADQTQPEHVAPGYLWQMPQGGVDPGEDLLAAARRELWEETNVRSGSTNGAARPSAGSRFASTARIARWISSIRPPASKNLTRGAGSAWSGCRSSSSPLSAPSMKRSSPPSAIWVRSTTQAPRLPLLEAAWRAFNLRPSPVRFRPYEAV